SPSAPPYDRTPGGTPDALRLLSCTDTASPDIYTLSLHDALPISFLKASHSFRNRLLVICKNAYLFATMIMTSVSSPFSTRSCKRSEERFSRNAETDIVCRLLLEKKKGPPICAVEVESVRVSLAHD